MLLKPENVENDATKIERKTPQTKAPEKFSWLVIGLNRKSLLTISLEAKTMDQQVQQTPQLRESESENGASLRA